MEWQEIFPINKRPNIQNVQEYLNTESFQLYNKYISFLRDTLNLHYIQAKYKKNKGWCFGVGASGLIMIKEISLYNSNFYVDGVEVVNEEVLNDIITLAEREYDTVFKNKYLNTIQKRHERAQAKKENNLNSDINIIDSTKFNKFKWASPVSIDFIVRLYESDAKGLINTKILDEVGYGFFSRCVQAKEEREYIKNQQIKCHNCSNIINSNHKLYTCDCGYQYTFDEYRKSFSKNKMLTGNAIPIFDKFILDWTKAESESEKMRIIDSMIHEIHVNINNGMQGRMVGTQLISGTSKQIKDMVLRLAYGENSSSMITNKEKFEKMTLPIS